MLAFLPSSDYSESASAATGVETLDYEYIQVGESKSRSIRIANQSNDTVNYFLAADSDWVEITPESGTLQADEISNTTFIEISPPLGEKTAIHSVDLVATTGVDVYRLELLFEVIGANETRQSQYPERRSDFTDNVSNVINRVSESFTLYRYDPVAYDESDNRVIIDPDQKRQLVGTPGSHRWLTQNFAERLNPLNSTWGYTRSDETILASFHDETNEIETSFTRDNSMMSYQSTAYLVVPAEFEFHQIWALFSPAKNPDPDQYKRTVYLIRRREDIWCLHNIYARYRGNELSHYEIELVQFHRQAMGSAAYYNPFALTYERDTDKPYAMYPVDYGDLFDSVLSDTSGSELQNPSENPSISPEPVETAPVPVYATISEDHHTLVVTFDQALEEVEIDKNNWSWQIGNDGWWAGSATVTGNQVTCEWNGFVELRWITTDSVCSYSPPPYDLFGTNGLQVEGFEGLAAS